MPDKHLDLLYLKAGGAGWGPIDALANLAARLLDANLLTVQDRGELSPAAKAAAFLPRRRSAGKKLLVLAANPALLGYAARREHWFPGYEQTAAWVIDSFWTDRISRFATTGRHFDQLFITDKDLVRQWRSMTRTPTDWLPWGTDTLVFKRSEITSERPTHLLRMGRQPQAWDDDNLTCQAGRDLGLSVSGRPPMGNTGVENQRIVRNSMLSTKFVLAFHNLVSPAPYTHPTRSYITARWTDALAAGATVVGAAPSNAPDILWPNATVEISPLDRPEGLRAVQALVDDWTPGMAEEQYERARKQLDWRWRLAELSEHMGWAISPLLASELTRLDASWKAAP